MPVHRQEAFPYTIFPIADYVMSEANSLQMPRTNQKLMQLAFQQSARVQKFQIDSAIRLLQMEYETIMTRMTHQSSLDTAHQEALGAVQTIAMLGSNVPKMSAQNCRQLDHRAESRCPGENERVLDAACTPDRKRNRDEHDASDRDIEAAHLGGHGKVVLTCEVCIVCRCLPNVLCVLIFVALACRRPVRSINYGRRSGTDGAENPTRKAPKSPPITA